MPYVSWGTDETQGIASLLGARRQRSLTILEQARFVDELLSTHQMTMADVAEMLSRSKAWVPAAGEPLEADGQPVGTVTSAVWSPRRNAPLGFAYVRTAHHQAGTTLRSTAGPAVVIDRDKQP